MQFTFWTILICAFSIMTYSESSSVVRLCGRKLVNAMKALCNHRYMTPETRKCCGLNMCYSFVETVIFILQHFLASLTQHHSPQSKNGIAQHCCFRPCSYTYLKSFCDDQQFISTTTTEQYNNEVLYI